MNYKMKNPYLPKLAKITRIIKETSDTKTYTLAYKTKYDPGQFVEVSVIGIGEAPISICSYSNKTIDLCIRDVGNVTHIISKLKKGNYLAIRGPYGFGYPMQYMINNDIIVVAGGTGVAPVRSVIEFIEQKRNNFRNVDIFLGFRSPGDVLFMKYIKRWQNKFNVHLTVDKADKSWKYNIGVVTKLLENSNLNNENKTVVTCGPPIMIKFVIQTLEKLGFHHDQIYVSFERLMKCGIGKCGHCMIKGIYVCKDGPVFRYDTVKDLKE